MKAAPVLKSVDLAGFWTNEKVAQKFGTQVTPEVNNETKFRLLINCCW